MRGSIAPLLGAFLFSIAAQAQQINHAIVTHSSVNNSTVDSTPIGQVAAGAGNFTALNAQGGGYGNSFTVGAGYSQFQFLPNGAPIRRGISWASDPLGDISFWVNSAENNALFAFRDGRSGAYWGTIQSNGWNGPVAAGSGNISAGSFNGGSFTGSSGNFAGNLTGGSVSTSNISSGYLGVHSQVPSGFQSSSQGGYLGWNAQVGRAETDFINLVPASGNGGGWSWYNTTNTSQLGASVMDLNGVGDLGVRSISTSSNAYIGGSAQVSGGLVVSSGATITGILSTNGVNVSGGSVTAPVFNGSVNGNASSASGFNHQPGTCADSQNNTYRLVGINADGSPVCAPGPMIRNSNIGGCTTGGNSYNTCGVTVSFAAFADTNYSIACTASNPGPDGRAVISGYANKGTNAFTLIFATEGGQNATFGGADCTMTHN